MSYSQAEAAFNVPKATISRKKRGLNSSQKTAGHPIIFSEVEEQAFVTHLETSSEWGFPYDSLDLRIIAKAYLEKIGR